MNRILDAATEGRLVAFVGVGASMVPPTCLPSWWEVNERVVGALAHQVEPLVGVDRANALASTVRDRQHVDRFPPEYQAELLAGRLGASYFPVLQCLDSDRPNAVHLRLAQLAAAGKLAALVTTNFDRALEAAFLSVGCSLRTYSRSDEFDALAMDLARRDAHAGSCVLLKLHGSAEDPSTLVDTLAQRKRGLPGGAMDCLRSFLQTSHWLFLGWSGADLDADPGYLGLQAASGTARGFTWLYRSPSSARASIKRLCDAYGERAAIEYGQLPDWLDEVTAPLLGPGSAPQDNADTTERRRLTSEQVAAHTHEWACQIGSASCTRGLAAILVAVGEPQAAIELLRIALEALPEQEPDGKERIMLECALASELAVTGQDSEALDRYQNAIVLLEARDELDRAAEVRCNAGLIYRARGDLEAAREAFEGVIAVTDRSGDRARRGVALHNLAVMLGQRAEFERATCLFREEIDILRQLGDEPNEAVAFNDLGEMLCQASRFDAAIEALNEAVRIRERLGNDRGRAMSLGNLAGIHFGRGDFESAATIYREVQDIFARLGDQPSHLTTAGNLAVVALRQGRPQEAVPALREAVSRAESMGREPELARLLMNLGEALRGAGDPLEAISVLRRSVAIWQRLAVLPGRAEALLELGITHWQLGQLTGAEATLQEALGIWESLQHEPAIAKVTSNLALVVQQRGQLDDALGLLERSNEIAERLGREAALARGKLNVGNIAFQQGRLDDALAAYTKAVEIADRLHLPAELAGACSSLAYTLGLTGRFHDALAAFHDAEARTATAAGFDQLAVRLEHLAQLYSANGHDQPASTFASEGARLRSVAARMGAPGASDLPRD